jgi:hypothetical protein
LQKSVRTKFKVLDRSNQVETQGKSLSTIELLLAQDAKHFQLTKNMFNHNPFSSQGTIAPLFSFRQSMIFGFLERCLAVFMKFCQPLISGVCQDVKVFSQLTTVVFEQLKIVFASMTESGGNDLIERSCGWQLPALSGCDTSFCHYKSTAKDLPLWTQKWLNLS